MVLQVWLKRDIKKIKVYWYDVTAGKLCIVSMKQKPENSAEGISTNIHTKPMFFEWYQI